MSQQLQVFTNNQFGEIRAIEKDGQPYFVAKDIATRLGYKDTSDAIKRHIDKEDKGVGEIPTPGGNQQTTIINESGLYSLILSSKLPTAKQFKRWVTSEVLPSIRKTGAYTAQPKMLTPTEQLELYLKALKENDLKVERVDQKIDNLKDNMPLFNVECKELQALVRKTGITMLGGYRSPAYRDNSLRGKVYADIQAQLKREFGVARYEAIKRCQLSIAKTIIEKYELPIVLEDEVGKVNNQIIMEAI